LELLEKYGGETEGSSILLSEVLKDEKSIPYYTILVREHGAVKLLELAYQTKEMDEAGKIRTSRPVYFQGILRRLGMKTKFKKDS